MKSILCLLLLSLIAESIAYIITVDSHAEECFFDHASAGSKLGKIKSFSHNIQVEKNSNLLELK